MCSASRKCNRSAGFTLIEVLVALAIATIMAIALTRFVVGTRANASKVGEALEMTALGETLLGRVAVGHVWSPGRTDGRSGQYSWRVEVTPIGMQAVARVRAKKEEEGRDTDAGENSGGGKNGQKMRSTFQLEPSELTQRRATASDVASEPMKKHALYRVALTIIAASGRSYATQTVRIGNAAGDEE